MMATPLSAIHFFTVAVFCLIGSAAVYLLAARMPGTSPGKGWRNVARAVASLALLCIATGLALSLAKRGDWPLQTAPEVILAATAAAMLWHLVHPYRGEWRWGALFYLGAAALTIWGTVRWPAAQATPAVQAMPPFWLFVSRLMLALACGAFIHAGATDLACLLTEKISHKICAEETGNAAVLLGLPFLSASLLLTVTAELYTRGVYWNCSIAESWQLLAWLFYAIIWCAWVILGWRGRRIWVLTTLGMVLVLPMLNAI